MLLGHNTTITAGKLFINQMAECIKRSFGRSYDSNPRVQKVIYKPDGGMRYGLSPGLVDHMLRTHGFNKLYINRMAEWVMRQSPVLIDHMLRTHGFKKLYINRMAECLKCQSPALVEPMIRTHGFKTLYKPDG